MKLSCLPVSLFKQIIDQPDGLSFWLDLVSILNLDGYDISINFIKSHSYTYLKQLKKQMDQMPLRSVMCNVYSDFTNPDHRLRNLELEYLRADIAICSYLEIPYIRVLAGQNHPGLNVSEGIKWAVDYLLKATEMANKHQVELLCENHAKPGSWDYIDITYPSEIFLQVYEGIKDSDIGINFDIGNVTAYGDDPLEILKIIYSKVKCIHVSDMKTSGVFDPVLIGTGVTPLDKVFSFLHQSNYQGWLSIEEAAFSGIAGVKKAIENTRMIWQKATVS